MGKAHLRTFARRKKFKIGSAAWCKLIRFKCSLAALSQEEV